jgi:hypothetical protein
MSVVYIIRNTVNKKVYIGKTSASLDERFRSHIYDSSKPRYKKRRVLYRAMQKYGVDKFYVEVLEDNLTEEKACEKEIYYINKYRSYVGFKDCNGYNMTLGGDGPHFADYDLIVDVLRKNDMNKSKTARELHCTRKTVCKACRELSISTPSKGLHKIVEMYDIATNVLLKTFSTLKSAKKYIHEISDSMGTALNSKNSYIVNGYLFKVYRTA